MGSTSALGLGGEREREGERGGVGGAREGLGEGRDGPREARALLARCTQLGEARGLGRQYYAEGIIGQDLYEYVARTYDGSGAGMVVDLVLQQSMYTLAKLQLSAVRQPQQLVHVSST